MTKKGNKKAFVNVGAAAAKKGTALGPAYGLISAADMVPKPPELPAGGYRYAYTPAPVTAEQRDRGVVAGYSTTTTVVSKAAQCRASLEHAISMLGKELRVPEIDLEPRTEIAAARDSLERACRLLAVAK